MSSTSSSEWIAPSTVEDRVVVILGAGVLGRRIAMTWVAAGYQVRVRDPSSEQSASAQRFIAQNAPAHAQTIKHEGQQGALEVTSAPLEQSLKQAWLVIEAVPENLQLKIDTFRMLDKHAPPDCILATNSSSYRSGEMIEHVQHRDRVINMHYQMPPQQAYVELMTCGHTNTSIFEFLIEHIKLTGMKPEVVLKESTGLIMNRVWAAVKRECINVVSEGVSAPATVDRMWCAQWGSRHGPFVAMDAVGLDTVAAIEDTYIKERGLDSKGVEFLRKEYVNNGRLGRKTPDVGGWYPPQRNAPASGPTVVFLDIGVHNVVNPGRSGRLLTSSTDGSNLKVLAEGLALPDGIDVDLASQRLFWTHMGRPGSTDGEVLTCKLDGSDRRTIVEAGQINTPKQLIVNSETSKLYFCDREGMRVMRCNYDGTELEPLVQTGDVAADRGDQTKWCVGISVDVKRQLVYWSQKGPSKGRKGKLLRAGLNVPANSTPANRKDIEVIFDNLPEPVDLELDEETQYLYWTDRGEFPLGNTLNRAYVGPEKRQPTNPMETKLGYFILARQFAEAIGLKLDKKNNHIYVTDLSGVYQFDLNGKLLREFLRKQGSFSGITLIPLQADSQKPISRL